MKDSILPADLDRLLKANEDVIVFDVRLESDRVEVAYPIPGVKWRNPEKVADWRRHIGHANLVVVYCVHGHHVSRSTRDSFRQVGINACILEGGIEGWCTYAEIGT